MENLKSGFNATSQAHPKFELEDITATTFAESLPIIQNEINGQLINCINASSLHELLNSCVK